MSSYNATKQFLRRATNQFKKTGKGIGAFLPTVREYNALPKKEQQFYQKQVSQYRKYNKRKTPTNYLARARSVQKLATQWKDKSLSSERKQQMQNARNVLQDATSVVESKTNGLQNSQYNIPAKKLNALKRHAEPLAKNSRDYWALQNLRTMTKTKAGNQLKLSTDSNSVSSTLKRYEAYESSSGKGYTVITDTNKAAKNGSLRGGLVAVVDKPVDQVIKELEQVEAGEVSINDI